MHTTVLVVHSVAHQSLQIAPASALDSVFIGTVMFVAPIAAVLFVGRPGIAWPLLLGSMVATFAYGASLHYILATPDNVAFVTPERWGLVFHVTTALLAAIEVAAILLTAALLVTLWRTRPSSESPPV